MQSNFRSVNFNRFPSAICDQHKYPIMYFNAERKAKKEERCWCQFCNMNQPILIEGVLQQIDYLANQQDQIRQSVINFKQTMNDTKKVIIDSIEQQFSQIEQSIVNLQYQISKIDRLFKYQTHGQSFQLIDLQQLAHILYSQNKDENSIEGLIKTFMNTKSLYQDQLVVFFKKLLEIIQSKFKQVNRPKKIVQQNQNEPDLQQISEISETNEQDQLLKFQQQDFGSSNQQVRQSQNFGMINSDVYYKQFKEQSKFELNGQVSCSIQLPNLQLLLGLQKYETTNASTLELLTFSGRNKIDKQEIKNNNPNGVTAIHYNENLKHILVGYQDGKIELYDLSEQWLKKSTYWEFSGSIQAIYSFKNSKSQNEFEMLSCGQIYLFKSFQVKNYTRIDELHQIRLAYGIINLIVLNDEKSVAILNEKELRFFHINSWDLFQTIQLQNPITSLEIENQLIIGSKQGTIELLAQKNNIDQFEVQTIIDLKNEVLQLLYLAETKQIFIRHADQVSIYEFNVPENQWIQKSVIEGKYYHLGIVKRTDKCEISLFQIEPSQIIIYE